MYKVEVDAQTLEVEKMPEMDFKEHLTNNHTSGKQLTCSHSKANIVQMITNVAYTAKKLNINIKSMAEINKT